MKPFKRIVILSTLVAGIVLFWLVPRINKADAVRYTRRYEDTDRKTSNEKVRDTIKTKTVGTSQPAPAKVYKKESIQSDDKFMEISSSKFSRAIQFEPEMIEVIEVDSIQEVSIHEDSVKVIL